MIKRVFFCTLLLNQSLLAVDSDIDGVDDAFDKCPNTPLTDLVDTDGCTIRSLQPDIHYDILTGIGYSQMNYASQEKADTTTETLQADYYNGNLWAQLSSSYSQSSSSTYSQSGFNDALAAVYFKFPFTDLILQSEAGILIPTYRSGYNNEATDYLGSISF
jgi:hypothetical protein